MRFIKLYQEGARSMAANAAIRRMLEVRRQASDSEGGLHISYPDFPFGWYWTAFENHDHADAFTDVLSQLDVEFEQSQEKPESVDFALIREEEWDVYFPPSGSSL